MSKSTDLATTTEVNISEDSEDPDKTGESQEHESNNSKYTIPYPNHGDYPEPIL